MTQEEAYSGIEAVQGFAVDDEAMAVRESKAEALVALSSSSSSALMYAWGSVAHLLALQCRLG
jgi:hypothetical protein